MDYAFYNLGQVLGITIINSLWQGLLVYLLVRLFLIAFPATNANKKYDVLCAALLMLGVWFAYTFYTEAANYNWAVKVSSSSTALNHAVTFDTNIPYTSTSTSQSFLFRYKQAINIYLPYLSALYLISVVINVARLALAWQKIRIIKRDASPSGALQQKVNDLVVHIGIDKQIQLSFSEFVDVPCAIGYIKPLLLLPVTITTQLSADEIEVILLHELAHIKNNDYLINLIQQVIALLLFLNPFAQLISRMINAERENRCDDIVLELAADPLTYAGALVKLEKTRQRNLRLALAATDGKYYLFARIQRIMKTNKPVVNIKHLVLAMVIFIGSLGSIAWLDPQIKDGKLVSVRGAKAVNQLVAVVKKAITPDVPLHVATSIEPDKVSITKADTIKIVPSTVKDSVKAYNERAIMVAEFRKFSNALVSDHYILDHLPEMKQALSTQKILDSVRENKEQAALTPELKQEIKDREDLWNQYFNSPEVLNKKAEQQRLLRALRNLLAQQPELIAFEKIEAVKKDSVRKSIMQFNSLSEDQLTTNEEYLLWLRHSSSEKSALIMQLNARPEIKLLDDSADVARRNIYSGPVFDALNKKTHASKALMDISTPTGLEKYKADRDVAKDKLLNTAIWKKYEQDAKRHDELVEKLKQTR